MTISKFYWNEDTINHFQFESSYQSKEETLQAVTDFVETECALEDGETEEDLIEDLMQVIYA
jgi:uncharacterized lipoprotein NlpE involved in copper resistance